VEHYEATMFPVRFRREADMGGRIVPIISAANDPSATSSRNFAVMHSGVFRNGVVMSGPKPEEGPPP
jgi:hypothetical protein